MPAPTYDDVLLPDDYAPGARGGGEYKVRIVRLPSGLERRFDVQVDPIYRFQISYPALDPAAAEGLQEFWHARKGGTYPFRFRDVTDYAVTNEPLAPTGAPTTQLIKTYSSGGRSWVRNIYAPAGPSPTSTVTLRKNGGAFAGYTLNLLTGLVTITALASQSITAITLGATTVVGFGAAPNAAFTSGSLIYLSGIVGTTGLNGQVGEVTAVGANDITLDINSTGMGAYVSGGTAAKYLHSTDTLDWTGQFHVVVRFDMQWPEFGGEAPAWLWLENVQLIEVKE